jgi:predicted acyltransferase
MDTDRSASPLPPRLQSLDTYRGFIMLAMASAGFGLAEVAGRLASAGEPAGWVEPLARQFDHVPWRGCVFWDLIQPSFLFMIGVAMPYSYAARTRRGESFGRQFAHAVWRSFLLVVLGLFLVSVTWTETWFNFNKVLAQMGLGYWMAFLLLRLPPRPRAAATAAILVGYWALFAFSPLPSPGTDLSEFGLGPDWEPMTGFAAHWEKNVNIASQFDRWFLNLFPRSEPFLYYQGGWTTLNFIPSMCTMVAGTLAGEWLRSDRDGPSKVLGLFLAASACLTTSTLLDPVTVLGEHIEGLRWVVCPIIKRIYTPAWVLYSNAWTCWMMGVFYLIVDVWGWRRWTFPFVVVGMNSIAVYLMSQLLDNWISYQLEIHLGTLFGWLHDRFGLPLDRNVFGDTWGPFYESVAVLAVFWLICFWMYRRKIFLRL